MQKKGAKIWETAFGAGCFWYVEEVFSKIEGVETEVGYMGGDEKKFPNPIYKQVCTDKTGYIEVVHLKFDPKKISYEKLLEVFWKIHDPTSMDRQGFDVGSQYKSAIFYYTKNQKDLAEKSRKTYEEFIRDKIVTEIKKAGKFFRAENYHHGYYRKHKLLCRLNGLFR